MITKTIFKTFILLFFVGFSSVDEGVIKIKAKTPNITAGKEEVEKNITVYSYDYRNILKRFLTTITPIPAGDFYPSLDTELKDNNGTSPAVITIEQNLKYGLFPAIPLYKNNYDPFELILFLNLSKQPLLSDFSKPGEDGKRAAAIVPAIVAHYASEVGNNQTKSDLIQSTVDLASLAIPGGQIGALGRLFYYADKVSSLASLAATYNREENPELTILLNKISIATGAISFVDLAGTGYKAFLKKNGNKLKDLPATNIAKELEGQSKDVINIIKNHSEQLTNLYKSGNTKIEDLANILEKEMRALERTITPAQTQVVEDAVKQLRNFEKLANAGGKLNLLGKLDNFTSLKTWVTNHLDDVIDANLISKLDDLDATYLSKLNTDLTHNIYGAEIKTLLKESPDDLTNIWKKLKDEPAYSWEIQKTGGSRWEKWGQREFFKNITKKGKDFEELVCKQAFKNRGSAKYLELKQKFQTDFGKNLDDYEMFSQVQLKYNSSGDYFIADQVFVKYGFDNLGAKYIDDMVVIENKLSSSTPFSPNQTSALQSNSYTVRSNSIESGTSSGTYINQNEVLNFSGSKQWYKVNSGGDGTTISNIQKVN